MATDNTVNSSMIIENLRDGGVEELTRLFMRWRPEFPNTLESDGSKLQRQEFARLLNGLIRRLPETDQEIIEMRHIESYSFRRIGDLLEINMEAAKKRYYRALDRIRELAKDSSDFENLLKVS